MKYRKIMTVVLAASIVAQANAINFQDVKDKVKDLYENHKTGVIVGGIAGAVSALTGAGTLAYFLKKKPKPKPTAKGLFRIGNGLKIAGLMGIVILAYNKRKKIRDFGKKTWNNAKDRWKRYFETEEEKTGREEREARERAEGSAVLDAVADDGIEDIDADDADTADDADVDASDAAADDDAIERAPERTIGKRLWGFGKRAWVKYKLL